MKQIKIVKKPTKPADVEIDTRTPGNRELPW